MKTTLLLTCIPLALCACAGKPAATGPDADADADGDADGDADADLDPDCELDPTAEGCPCDEAEPITCFTGAPGIVGEGYCRGGIQGCEDGSWGPCVGEVLPQPERCNVFDDDCDGVADEGIDCGEGPVPTHPCEGTPAGEALGTPELEMHWGHEPPRCFPSYVQVVGTPVVGNFVQDLDEDIPEIIMITYKTFQQPGVLRVLSGRAPHDEIWVDAGWGNPGDEGDTPRLADDVHIALGDLDRDGWPEVVVAKQAGGLVAYEGDGDILWESAEPTSEELGKTPAISIADLDADGFPEVIVGRVVLDNEGELLWRGSAGSGNNRQGPISCVADVDDDGEQEVIAGRTVYEPDGTILWDLGEEEGDGFCAIADVYDLADPDDPQPGRDGLPEVIRAWDGVVYIHEGETGAELDQWAVPGAGGGGGGGGGIVFGGGVGGGKVGPPTVADFDGDGLAEIGVAGASVYAVWDVDGDPDDERILWQNVTEDDSSNVTGSTVFDFNGDGISEVIYNDEQNFRVYNGPDGEELLVEPNPSRTRTEQPIVVDVDADGNAEILFIANNEVAFAGDAIDPEERVPGIEIYGSSEDTWVPARPIWNQHTYHFDNVGDGGEIPVGEAGSWLTHNTYRANQPGDLVVYAPDLTADFSPFDESRCHDRILRVCAAIQNTGEYFVGPGIRVTFYEGNPEDGGIALFTTETTRSLDPGTQEVVCGDVPEAPLEPTQFWVVVDSEADVRECVEDNNVVFIGEGFCVVIE